MEVYVLPAVQRHVVPLHRQLGHVHEEAACQGSPYRVRITRGLYRHACAIQDLVEDETLVMRMVNVIMAPRNYA